MPHRLIRLTFRPRVVAFFLILLIVISPILDRPLSATHLAFALFLIIYPHLLNYLVTRLCNSSRGARLTLLADAMMVGVVISATRFDPLTGVSLVALLVFSTLIVARPGLLMPLFVVLGVSILLSGILPGDDILIRPNIATGIASATCLIGYVGFVAWLVFRETSRLTLERRSETSQRVAIESTYNRLKPYLAPEILEHNPEPEGLLAPGHISAISPAISPASDPATCPAVSPHTGQPPPEDDQPGTDLKHRTGWKQLTIFFSDIEEFASLMDEEGEVTVAGVLNEYFNQMIHIATLHGGTVDKFMGDGVMVFFGDPRTRGADQDACACVAMALQMRASVNVLAAKWAPRLQRKIHTRTGIHTGYCLVGSFGSMKRLDYTALGSAVNIASRLENMAAPDEILITETTRKLVSPRIKVSSRRSIQVKGIADPLSVYSVAGLVAES